MKHTSLLLLLLIATLCSNVFLTGCSKTNDTSDSSSSSSSEAENSDDFWDKLFEEDTTEPQSSYEESFTYEESSEAESYVYEQSSQSYKEDKSSQSYVLNTNTMKFHKPGCSSVKKIAAGNRSDYDGTRDSVINMGYEPCKKCNP